MTESSNEYGEAQAATYDENVADWFSPSVVGPTVSFLAALAGDGPVLEFAIGTGRIGLPLSASGVAVQGIEQSEPILTQLRQKSGAANIGLTRGDMSVTRVDGSFSLVYLVFNTIMNLTSQQAQVQCFRNAAAHLAPGGCFVVEVLVPRLRQLAPGECVQPFNLGERHLGFDRYTDFNGQILESHHYRNDGGRFVHSFSPFRWVWPAELDLMAQLAGLKFAERWADWDRQPFTDDSDKHVSVWTKAD